MTFREIQQVQVRMERELVERLDAQADRRMVARSHLINRACRALLDELEDYDDELDRAARAVREG